MTEALVYGAIAAGALVLGSLLGVRIRLPQRVLAAMLAFAAGTLVTAMAFELFEESVESGGVLIAAVAFLVGAVVFVTVSSWLDRRVETSLDVAGSPKVDIDAAASDVKVSPSSVGSSAGLALLAAAILDGVPEQLALGISLGEPAADSGGVVLLVAIFLSNFPEALVGAASMQEQGTPARKIVLMWTAVAVALTMACVLGRALLSTASGGTVSIPLAFAGGAVIAALADTFMPEAYEKGGSLVALATAGGFLLSFLLSVL
jgi:zinc transporter, ZIP family